MLYRVTQESLSNVVQHSGASAVRVELSFVGRTVLRVRDDGCGFKPANGNGRATASASPACASARCWSAAASNVFSAPGEGTTIELTMGAT